MTDDQRATPASTRVGTPERQRQDERFAELRAAGATFEQIAAEFGITKQAISARYTRRRRATRGPMGDRRCLRRRDHAPHIARWHNDVTTLCDGQPGGST